MKTLADIQREELNRRRHVCPHQPHIGLFRVTDRMLARITEGMGPEVRRMVITEELEKAAQSGRRLV